MSAATELLQRRTATKPATAPESAYARAKHEWDDRIGGSLRSARNWRLATFGALAVAAMAVAGLIYQSSKSSVVPFYVRVAENGQPFIVGAVPETFNPTFNEVRWQLAQWLEWVRSMPLDPVVVRRNYSDALGFMRQSAANKLNDWAQHAARLQNVGRETVDFQLTSIAPISGSSSYQARWQEVLRDSGGGVKSQTHWIATFDIDVQPPKTADAIQRNPLGIYIKDFQWTREQ